MSSMDLNRLNFDSPAALASALADRVAAELSLAIAERKQAVLAVSGGKTPELFFHYLAKIDIDWKNIIITLVDERYVPVTDERSNERLVRTHLLQHHAAKARFYGLYHQSITAELGAFSAASRINGLPQPFDVVMLGMGLDGHTASFFPGASRLSQAIDPNSRALILPIQAKNVSEPRLTLTLPIICHARFIALQIEGHDKREKFEEALQDGPETEMPIRAVLHNARHPIQVYWSPTEGDRSEPRGDTTHFDAITI
ncbi:6-phosphogluconolactonase [Bartonella tamiae]|uniref:6-phosphogluconolactonase n=1 Tax=Bartonella tamiae Th239 TaxID=1094558 RepID=J0QU23_9HYPH|nr:6-phosphogluconolactonase [Bartonella tamiae]EJF89391.1 6-phosphogluconolactonase [Bartonella tamiae Th239]EJF92744.1 6-phosphogluconolactonase [Bartonella tamiae Th307]